jgi:quercetin dioxygenase-like cupin family protein
MTVHRGVIRRPTPGESLRILLRGDESDDSLGAVEMTFEPKSAGPPLHMHPGHAEAFYVLAGELTFQLGDEVVTAGPGSWACAPKNTPHTLANHATHPGRVLCLFAPAGFERRFERMLAQGPEGEALAELAEAERATQLLGPPLTPPD